MASPSSSLSAFDATRYASLRTFRPDGSWVETPIWFAREFDHFYFRTGESAAKIKRIRRNSRVELRPSDYRGRYTSDAPVAFGTACICGDEERRRGEVHLKARYRWQWNIIPMIPVPGLSAPHPRLTLKERVARARSKEPLPGTCVLRVDVATCSERVE
ncbi:MAG: PPOX class F420-dependent oxidoreductase [Acidimicrobiales bacterium]|jgi:PPOX class probable F420-dependent enzyme